MKSYFGGKMDFYALNSQEILDRISRHCPDALSAYLQCINRADSQGTVFFSRELVEVEMSETWTKFKNSIKKLALEDLLEWYYFNEGIAVTLAEVDDCA